MKDYAHEQAHRLGLSLGPQLTAPITATAATTDVTLVADPGDGHYVVIEDLQLTLAAAGTVAVWSDVSSTGTMMSGSHVRIAAEQFLRLQNMLSDASEAVVLGRTNIAVGGHVTYRILSPRA
jgi:hypothetical protein